MKIKALGLSLLFFVCTLYVHGQSKRNKISEGIITYTVEWSLPEQMQEMQSNFPSQIKIYFKADSSAAVTESPMYTSSIIMHLPSDFERLLLDIPLMGKKYSVIFGPEDRKKMLEQMPSIELKETKQTKTLAGYQVRKYDGRDKKSDQAFDAWFSKDVDIIPNALSRFYEKSYGFPVEFTSFLNGFTLKASLKEVKKMSVPVGVFSGSKDYEEITVDQLIQLSGAGQ